MTIQELIIELQSQIDVGCLPDCPVRFHNEFEDSFSVDIVKVYSTPDAVYLTDQHAT